VPRINDTLLKCVLYLYPTREAAEAGERIGGTGFLAGVQSAFPNIVWPVAVSAKHVVCERGCSVLRANTRAGSVSVLETEPHDWHQHPEGDDLVVLPIGLSMEDDVFCIPEDIFLNTEVLNNKNSSIGIGDDVFMIGRFINHDGKQRNEPSVRFGNISIMPKDKIKQQMATCKKVS
jgi:hypothetical protein